MSISSNKQSSFRRAKKQLFLAQVSISMKCLFIPADAYVIAADGGYDHVTALGVTPHALLEIWIQLSMIIPVSASTRMIELPAEKDDSDMMVAVRYAWQLGIRSFEFYGVFGGRMDHSFANIQLAAKLQRMAGLPLCMLTIRICTVNY